MGQTTKDRILNVAERLFAVHGLEGTSLRMITSEASVNLAAVNYHFGSKEGLIQAAFQRRVSPINRERLRRLSEYEQELQGARPELDVLLQHLIEPPFCQVNGAADDPLFLRLVGRLYTDPAEQMREMFLKEFAIVLERYQRALGEALPEMPLEEIVWRVHFTIGMLAHALLASDTLHEFTGGLCDPSDHQAVVDRLVAFAVAGFRR